MESSGSNQPPFLLLRLITFSLKRIVNNSPSILTATSKVYPGAKARVKQHISSAINTLMDARPASFAILSLRSAICSL